MAKNFLIIFIILFLLIARPSLANIFNQDTLPIENYQNVPDPLLKYQVQGEADEILQKTAGKWQKINNWGIGLWAKYIEPYFGDYIDEVEQNIKQGWEEEKQEYRQDFLKALGVAWEKIKNFVLHR